MSNPKKVFISRSKADVAFAGDLAKLLAARGTEVFAFADMTSVDSWAGSLRTAIEQASALGLIIPGHDVPNRNNVWFEAGAAKALGKRILAILPPDGVRRDVPDHLADILILDADRRSLGRIADTLVQAIPAEETAIVAD